MPVQHWLQPHDYQHLRVERASVDEIRKSILEHGSRNGDGDETLHGLCIYSLWTNYSCMPEKQQKWLESESSYGQAYHSKEPFICTAWSVKPHPALAGMDMLDLHLSFNFCIFRSVYEFSRWENMREEWIAESLNMHNLKRDWYIYEWSRLRPSIGYVFTSLLCGPNAVSRNDQSNA